MDLRFPHHENEIAQTEGATGCRFVNTWMHNGFVQLHEEKMSKSLGNFFTIRDLVGQDDDPARAGEVIRFLVLLSHYRSPLNFSAEVMDQARAGLERLYSALFRARERSDTTPADPEADNGLGEAFDKALEDDFNTPSAIAVLFDLVRGINRALEAGAESEAKTLANQLEHLGGRLGLLYQEPATILGIGGVREGSTEDADTTPSDKDALIETLIETRRRARQEKDFQLSDEVRAQLEEMGVTLEDRPDGSTSWRRR